MGRPMYSPDTDYAIIKNKPRIGGVELDGDMKLSDLGMRSIHYGTKEEWDAAGETVSEDGAIYIYSDFDSSGSVTRPAIKIGNGVTKLKDLPVLSGAGSADHGEALFDAMSALVDGLYGIFGLVTT